MKDNRSARLSGYLRLAELSINNDQKKEFYMNKAEELLYDMENTEQETGEMVCEKYSLDEEQFQKAYADVVQFVESNKVKLNYSAKAHSHALYLSFLDFCVKANKTIKVTERNFIKYLSQGEYFKKLGIRKVTYPFFIGDMQGRGFFGIEVVN